MGDSDRERLAALAQSTHEFFKPLLSTERSQREEEELQTTILEILKDAYMLRGVMRKAKCPYGCLAPRPTGTR